MSKNIDYSIEIIEKWCVETKLKIENNEIIIIFSYLNIEKKKVLENVGNRLENYIDRKILILGDMNARIGKEKRANIINEENECREAKDNIINDDGKILIDWCKKYGLCILNGECKGDKEGKYTCYGKSRTTIDYGLCNYEC